MRITLIAVLMLTPLALHAQAAKSAAPVVAQPSETPVAQPQFSGAKMTPTQALKLENALLKISMQHLSIATQAEDQFRMATAQLTAERDAVLQQVAPLNPDKDWDARTGHFVPKGTAGLPGQANNPHPAGYQRNMPPAPAVAPPNRKTANDAPTPAASTSK